MNQFVLDAYAARSCPVKTFNAFDPVLRKPEQPLDESLRESFQGGSDFRDLVLESRDRDAEPSPEAAACASASLMALLVSVAPARAST